MQPDLVNALRARRKDVCVRWADLLHTEPVASPLGNPDTLVHLIDWTLEEIFRGLAALSHRRQPARIPVSGDKPHCACGRNPLLAYFIAGEQAMQEALILVQAATPLLDPIERDTALIELNLVLQQIAHREIESFCGVCQPRFAEAAAAPPRPALGQADVFGSRHGHSVHGAATRRQREDRWSSRS